MIAYLQTRTEGTLELFLIHKWQCCVHEGGVVHLDLLIPLRGEDGEVQGIASQWN